MLQYSKLVYRLRFSVLSFFWAAVSIAVFPMRSAAQDETAEPNLADSAPKPQELVAVEAVLKKDLTRHYAAFLLRRTSPAQTYAEYFYARYNRQYHIGIFLTAIGPPVFGAATAGGILGLLHIEPSQDCNEDGECSISWGAALGIIFGVAVVGTLGTILTIGALTAGIVLIAKNHHRVKRLNDLANRNERFGALVDLSPGGLRVRF